MSYYNYDDRRKYEIDDFGTLIGRVILDVVGAENGSEEIRIVTDNGTLVMFHSQDCCEHVSVEDITGDVTIRWLGESNGYYSERVDLMWWPVGVSL